MEILIAAALVCLAVVGCSLWVIDRMNDRAHTEREALLKLVDELALRIQHPERLPVQEYPKSSKPHHLPYEDDNAWRSFVESNN